MAGRGRNKGSERNAFTFRAVGDFYSHTLSLRYLSVQNGADDWTDSLFSETNKHFREKSTVLCRRKAALKTCNQ